MAKFIDTNEVVTDLGAAVTAALKNHGIAPSQVRVNVGPEEIRILIDLEDEGEIQPSE